jgi:hypothetical protein
VNASKFEEIKERLADLNPEALLADGFEEALIGTAHIFTKTIALYDYNKCIDILMERDGMDIEGAVEYFEYNVIGAYVGENTPAFAVIG